MKGWYTFGFCALYSKWLKGFAHGSSFVVRFLSGFAESHSRETHLPFLPFCKLTAHPCRILERDYQVSYSVTVKWFIVLRCSKSKVLTVITVHKREHATVAINYKRPFPGKCVLTMTKLSGFVGPWLTGPSILPSDVTKHPLFHLIDILKGVYT